VIGFISDVAIKEGMLAHNSFRLLHHVQPLQWNESLAEQAQRVAKTIANDPSSFQVKISKKWEHIFYTCRSINGSPPDLSSGKGLLKKNKIILGVPWQSTFLMDKDRTDYIISIILRAS